MFIDNYEYNLFSGNVLIRDGHTWGYICDDGWDLDAAHVVCRMLGFKYAQGFTPNSFFGQTNAGTMG